MILQLFEKWQSQLLDRMIAECRELVEDTNFPIVKQWHEAGEKWSAIFRFISQKRLRTRQTSRGAKHEICRDRI